MFELCFTSFLVKTVFFLRRNNFPSKREINVLIVYFNRIWIHNMLVSFSVYFYVSIRLFLSSPWEFKNEVKHREVTNKLLYIKEKTNWKYGESSSSHNIFFYGNQLREFRSLSSFFFLYFFYFCLYISVTNFFSFNIFLFSKSLT